MKLACIVGAALMFGATIGSTAFAAETPAGGWQEAACCQPGPLGTCQRYCDPPAAAVRGEKPESETPAGKPEPKAGDAKEKKPDSDSNK